MDNLTVEMRDAYVKAKEYIGKVRTNIREADVEELYLNVKNDIKKIQDRYLNNEGIYGILTDDEHKKVKLHQEVRNASNRFLAYVQPIVNVKHLAVLEEELAVEQKNREAQHAQEELLSLMRTESVAVVDPAVAAVAPQLTKELTAPFEV